jgi:hypothetical protein
VEEVGALGRWANQFEHAFEAFYNFAVTPAAHVSLDLQVIKSVSSSRDTAVAVGTRFQLDF